MSQPQSKKDPLNDYFNGLSVSHKLLFVIGVICLVASAMLTIFNLGFDISSSTSSNLGFMSNTTMWAVNVTLGMIGGLCFAPRKMVPAIVAGGIATAAITGITLFYTSWRESLYAMELSIPVFIGVIIGWKSFALLGGKPKKMVDEDWNIWTGYNGKKHE